MGTAVSLPLFQRRRQYCKGEKEEREMKKVKKRRGGG
jgi:hypothetical protein